MAKEEDKKANQPEKFDKDYTPETNEQPKPMVPAGSEVAPPPSNKGTQPGYRTGSTNPAGSDTGSYNPQGGTGNVSEADRAKSETPTPDAKATKADEEAK